MKKQNYAVWESRLGAMSIISIILGLALLVFDTESKLILSGVGLIVCMLVCLIGFRPKSLKDNKDTSSFEVFEETIDGFKDLSLRDENSDITGADVDKFMSDLIKWKEENHFRWCDNKDKVIKVRMYTDGNTYIRLKDRTDRSEYDTTVDASHHVFKYVGQLSYFMTKGDKPRRIIKVGDTQLGELSLGILTKETYQDWAGKEVQLSVLDNKIVGIQEVIR